MCASIWAGVQYMVANGGRDTTCPFSRTSRLRSRPQLPTSARYGSSSAWRGGGLTRACSSASSGTTHGEIDVANDLARKGPSGVVSQAWMSGADQAVARDGPTQSAGD